MHEAWGGPCEKARFLGTIAALRGRARAIRADTCVRGCHDENIEVKDIERDGSGVDGDARRGVGLRRTDALDRVLGPSASRDPSRSGGRFAASGHLDSLQLFRGIMLASALITGIFPPVIIGVEAPNGQRYDEIHCDGEVSTQVFFYPAAFSFRDLPEQAVAKPHAASLCYPQRQADASLRSDRAQDLAHHRPRDFHAD